MKYSLRPETMYRISEAQEPAFVDPETDERLEIESAMILIKNGIEYNNHDLIRKGVVKLIPVCFGIELNLSDLLMLAARKAIYAEQIEEVKDYVSQITTTMS